jgi:ribonucleoside-diphosphate reductase alpha chain
MINEAVRDVLKERYLQPNEKDEHDMFRRVVNAIIKPLKSKKKELAEAFMNALEEGTIMPNSPALMNLGTGNQMASACFVVPIEDSMDGIFNAIHDAAIIHKLGGGTGFCFSSLRPANSLVQTTNGKASGPLSFLRVFDVATGTVKQAGKRRGANMATFMCDHPDLIDFINIKDKEGDIANFNLSVMLTDKFMEAVKANQPWELKWKDKTHQTLAARDIFDMIVRQSWKNGEPGILFIDTINREQTPENFIKEYIAATNPCGEQPLEAYGSCNLAAINLGQMVMTIDNVVQFDWPKFRKNIELIIGMLDMILDVCDFPLPQIKKKSLETRRIGAGVMGFADLLIKLNIKYGSDDCIKLIHSIMSEYKEKAHLLSIAMGEGKRKHKALLTIAPTGTTSMFCNASSGIEPYFNYWHERTINDKKVLVFEGIINSQLNQEQRDFIINCHNAHVPVDTSRIALPEHFVKSSDISWKDHIRVQATFQQYVDSSISKTINMPNSATEKDVADAIFMAWELKCKGLTVYRDGSREKQVLNNIGSVGKINDPDGTIVHGEITLPQEMDAKTYRIKASLGKEEPDQSFYIHLGLIRGKPVQLFIDYKRQSDNSSEVNQLKAQMIESLGMSISYQMRYNVPITVIIKQLRKIPFSWMMSLHVQIASILSRYLGDNIGICEKCKGKIEFKEGCKTCPCGHSNGCG